MRVALALDSIQEAQRLLQQAQRALSNMEALSLEWKSVASVSERLTQTWFALSAGANRLRRKGRLRCSPELR